MTSDGCLFCHPATENGMLITDVEGGSYTHLRTQDEFGGTICHFLGTRRGATYEVLSGSDGPRAGVCDPLTGRTYELALPREFDYIHTGRDPEGLLWMFENHSPQTHDLHFLVRHDPSGADDWLALTADWPTYGDPDAQKGALFTRRSCSTGGTS
jgi:hypothetical protein